MWKIVIFQTLLDDLQRKLPAILQAKDGVKTMLDGQTNENPEDCKLHLFELFSQNSRKHRQII